jgi:LacI family transcriptional regulator
MTVSAIAPSLTATIEDVAREADVSVATVSRVLNGSDHVRDKTRHKVLDAAQRLGYVMNQQARRLAGGKSHVIGLLVRDLSTGYIGEIIRGIDDELAGADYDLMLHTAHAAHRRNIDETEQVVALTRGLADGLLLVLPRNPGAYLESLRQRNFPHVLIDHQGINDQSPSVGATNRKGAYDATRYLIELGHRRIGFITGTLDLGCARARLEGYKAALADASIRVEAELVREGDFHQPEGYACAKALLSLTDPPTAIFASNDVMAFGAMEATRDAGLRIPDDVSIIGFDDIPQSDNVNPPLTTVRQPLEQMGRTAARMLIECIAQGKVCEQQIELPTELVIRASCQARVGQSTQPLSRMPRLSATSAQSRRGRRPIRKRTSEPA